VDAFCLGVFGTTSFNQLRAFFATARYEKDTLGLRDLIALIACLIGSIVMEL